MTGSGGQEAATGSSSMNLHNDGPSHSNATSDLASSSADHRISESSGKLPIKSAASSAAATSRSGQQQSAPPPPPPLQHHQEMYDSDDPYSLNNSGSKRPRLRLAHACDRCRRRKIRCDTQQPCGPCSHTGNLCTFEAPTTRRLAGGAGSAAGDGTAALGTGHPHGPAGSGGGGSSSGSGPSHSHSARKNNSSTTTTSGHGGGSSRPPGGGGAANSRSADLESRLHNLEALLRRVPPSVHNALINTLDQHLNSAGGASSASATSQSGSTGGGGGRGRSGAAQHAAMSSNDTAALAALLASAAAASTASSSSDAGANGGDDDVARAIEGLSLSNGYLYLDEIGQTKWQGATSGFPLLDLLTAARASELSDAAAGNQAADDALSAADFSGNVAGGKGLQIANPFGSRDDHSKSGSSGKLSSSPTTSTHSGPNPIMEPTFSSILDASTSPDGFDSALPTHHVHRGRQARTQSERYFPGRAPRPSQMLNPEATWRLITNVIPGDLMDTLVRCYLSTSHLLWPFLHVPSFLEDYANPSKWAEPGFACFVVAVCTLSSRHVDDTRVRAKVDDPSTAGKQYFELFKRLRDLPSADRPTLYSIQAAYLAAIYAFGLGTLSKAFSLLAESVTLCLDGGLHRSVEGYEYFTPIEQEMRKRTFWSIYSWDKQSAALFGRPPIIHLRDCDVPEPLQIDDEYITKDGILDQPKNTQTRLSAFVAVIRLHVVLEGVIDACVTPSSFESSSFLARAASTISKRSHQSIPLLQEEALLEEWASILPTHWHYNAETVESKDPIRITQAERLHCLEHLVRMIIYRHRFSGFVQIPAATDDERARFFEYCKKAMDSALTICANHVHISQRGMMTYYGVHVIHQLAQAGRTLVAVVLNCKTPEFSPLIAPATEGLRSCVGLLRRFSGRYLCGLRSADIIEEFCRICHIPVDAPRGLIGDGRPSPAWLRPVQKRQSPSPAPRRKGSSTRHSEIPNQPSSEPAPVTNAPNGINAFEAFLQQTPTQNQQQFQDLSSLFAEALDNPASANALLSTQDFFDLSAAGSPLLSTSLSGQPSTQTNQAGNVLDTLGPASAPFDQFETLEPDAVMSEALPDQSWDVPFASGNDALGQMSASTILSLMQQGTFSSSWV